jgi:hypothetical protein
MRMQYDKPSSHPQDVIEIPPLSHIPPSGLEDLVVVRLESRTYNEFFVTPMLASAIELCIRDIEVEVCCYMPHELNDTTISW